MHEFSCDGGSILSLIHSFERFEHLEHLNHFFERIELPLNCELCELDWQDTTALDEVEFVYSTYAIVYMVKERINVKTEQNKISSA